MTGISVSEAATELGVSRGRVHALIREKRLPATKVGKQYVVRRADLQYVRIRKPGRPTQAALEQRSKREVTMWGQFESLRVLIKRRIEPLSADERKACGNVLINYGTKIVRFGDLD